MKIGAMNKPSKDPISEIEKIARLGFDFIDFTYEWPSNKNLDPNEIKKRINEAGLEVVGHTSPFIPAIYPNDGIREACFDEIKEAAEFFYNIGASKMNIHPFYFQQMDDEQIVLSNLPILSRAMTTCKNLGLTLMLENYFAPFDRAETFGAILELIPDLKIHLDIGHLNLYGDLETELDAFLQFEKKIVHCHVHDNNGGGDDHMPLCCGEIDWDVAIEKIKSAGYNGTITLEVFCSNPEYLRLSRKILRQFWERNGPGRS